MSEQKESNNQVKETDLFGEFAPQQNTKQQEYNMDSPLNSQSVNTILLCAKKIIELKDEHSKIKTPNATQTYFAKIAILDQVSIVRKTLASNHRKRNDG